MYGSAKNDNITNRSIRYLINTRTLWILLVIVVSIAGSFGVVRYSQLEDNFDIRREALEINTTFTIDLNDKRQIIDGFGSSTAFEDEWAWTTLESIGKLDEFLDMIFSPTEGVGLNILRSELDQAANPSPGVYNWQKIAYSAEFMKAAKERGVTRFFSTAFTVPQWMKDGANRLKPEHYQNNANFIADYLTHIKNEYGVDAHSISIANEPDIDNQDPQHTVFSPEQIRDFTKVLGPTLDARGIGTGVLVAESFRWFGEWYAKETLEDEQAASHLNVVGAHGYAYVEWLVDFTLTKALGKKVWQTEGGGIEMEPDTSIVDGVLWAKDIHNYLTNPKIEASAWLYWWIISRNQGARNTLVGFDGNNITYYKRLYTMGNYSRFVRTGYQRVQINPASSNNVYLSAFINPANQKLVIVAINDNNSAASINVNIPGDRTLTPYHTTTNENLAQKANVTANGNLSTVLPAMSVVTFVEDNSGSPPPPQECDSDAYTRACVSVELFTDFGDPSFVPPDTPSFNDVSDDPNSQYYSEQYKEIEWMAAEDITTGCGGNNFCPNQAATRAMAAVFLYNAGNLEEYGLPPTEPYFNDVSQQSHPWAFTQIQKFAELEITQGCNPPPSGGMGSNYCPNDTLNDLMYTRFRNNILALDPPSGEISVSLKLKLQGIETQIPDTNKVFAINLIGSQNYNRTPSCALGDAGVFTCVISGIKPGTYTVKVKGPVHLRKDFGVKNISASSNVFDLTSDKLLTGDIILEDSDNRIDALDIGQVIIDYFDSPTDSLADLNLDDTVNAIDIGFVIINYLMEGDL